MELENQKQNSNRTIIMKKALCFLMTMLMLMSTFSGTVSVFATEGLVSDGSVLPASTDGDDGLVTDGNVVIEDLFLGDIKNVDINSGEFACFRFIPEESGVYTFHSFKNSGDPYISLCDRSWREIASDDDNGAGNNFLVNEHLKAGATYYITAKCYNNRAGEYSFSVKAGAKAIAFEPVSEFVLTEGISNGYYETMSYYDETIGDYVSETFYRYDNITFRNGDKLLVTEADGTETVYVFDEYEGYFADENGMLAELSYYADQYADPWMPGDTQTLTLVYEEQTCSLTVKILPNPVKSISFKAAKPYIYTEGISDGEYETHGYYDEAADEWKEEVFFEYYLGSFNNGDTLTVNYKDGSVKNFIYDSMANYEEGGFVAGNGEMIDLEKTSDQYTNHWTVGGSHNYFTVTYAGLKYAVPVTIKPNPVVSVSFTPVMDFILYEGISDGDYDYDNDDNEFYYYYIRFRDGDKITVKRTDGSSTEYVYSSKEDHSNLFFDKNGTGIYVDVNHDQYANPWVPGGEYNFFNIIYASQETRVPLTVIAGDLPDASSAEYSFVPAKEIVLTEGTSEGYYETRYCEDENGNAYQELYYYYYLPEFSEGDKIIAKYSDGTTKDYYYRGDEGDRIFESASGEKFTVYRQSEQYEHPWKPGGEYNYFTIYSEAYDYDEDEYYNIFEIDIPVTIQPSDVKSVSFESTEKFSVIEYISRGYNENGFYYYYNPSIPLGSKLIVEKNNGTKEIYTYSVIYDEYDEYNYHGFINEKGVVANYSYYNNQEINHWMPGGEHNFLYITIGGKTAEIPVEVLPNPYVSFTYVPVSKKTLIEGISDGYYEYCDECEKEFYYYYEPAFEIGDKIIAEKTDGTKTEYTFDPYNYYFISPQGEYVHVSVRDNQFENHWTTGSEHTYTITFGTLTTECKVNVIPNNIKSVSFTPVSEYELIENVSSGYYEWNEIEDEVGNWYEEKYYYYYLPRFVTGDTINVSYTDGTSEKYVYDSDENRFISSSGKKYYADTESEQYENHWAPGGEHNYFYLVFRSYEVKVPVTVRKSDVEDISFTPANEYVLGEKSSEGYYNYLMEPDENTGEHFYKKHFCYYIPSFNEGDKLTVKLTDGTVINAVYNEDYGDFYCGNMRIRYLNTYDNQSNHPWVKGGKHNYFTVEFSGKTCTVPVTIGDCGHRYINHEAKAPTCTAKGWAAYVTCKFCDYTTYKEIPATGHKYTASVTKAATCAAAGTMLYKCSCGSSYTKAIPATGKHTPVVIKGTPATYKAAGKTDGSKCSVCGKIIKAQTTVAKLKLGKISGLKTKKITLAKSASAALSWNKVKGAEKYEVYQQKGKKWIKVKTTASNSLTVKKLKAGSTYKYKVRAIVTGGAGSYSSVLTVKMVPASTSLKLKAGKKQITASWNAVSGVTGYEVQYSTSKKFSKKTTKTVTIKKAKTKKTTIKKLTKGKKYYVRVRAYQKIGSKTYYGVWTVKNVKSK